MYNTNMKENNLKTTIENCTKEIEKRVSTPEQDVMRLSTLFFQMHFVSNEELKDSYVPLLRFSRALRLRAEETHNDEDIEFVEQLLVELHHAFEECLVISHYKDALN